MSLIYFYGKECPHCRAVEKLIKKLEQEEGIVLDWKEIWHNNANLELAEKYDKEIDCGGVPMLINTDTDRALCGEISYDELKSWAKGVALPDLEKK